MIVSIHQPNFFPWIGFFDKINRSNHFVFLTSSNRSKGDKYLVRTSILNNSKCQYLSIPLGSREMPINQLMMPDNDQWKVKALNVIRAAYNGTKFYDEVLEDVNLLLSNDSIYFSEYCINIINFLIEKLSIETVIHTDTDFDKNFGTSNERNLAICKEIGADVYLSGNGAKAYNDSHLFKKNSINLVYQNYFQPSYKQKSSLFVPGLSIIDMLFNCGYEETERLLKNNNGIC